MTARNQPVIDPTLAVAPTGRRVLQPKRGLDTHNSHPAMGLEVDTLLAFFRAAERGIPVRQFDMFDDMIEKSGHLRGLINTRIEFVAGSDWSLKAGRADKPSELAAAALDERLRNHLGFREFFEHQLTAPYYGIAPTNLVWDFVEGVIVPVEFINAAHRRFASPTAERASEVMLIGGDFASDLITLEPGLWAVSRYRGRNPWAAGLMRTCAWWEMIKGWAIRDWQVFARMFGLPLVLGFYEEGAPPDSRLKLEEAVKMIGEDGWAVLSDLTNIVIKDTARGGDSSTVYQPQIALAEAQESKLIAGSTTASETGGAVGSYALGAVHESRAYSLARADARRLEETFTRDIGRWFVQWNGYARAAPPRLKIQIARDSLERARVLQIVGQAIDIDEDQAREEFSLTKPAAGKGFRMPQTKVPSPGA